MTELNNSNHTEVDIHEILERQRKVAVIWCIEDVQEMRSDLTDDQSWEVLQLCKESHDCNHGFTWFHIESVAESLFPSPEEAHADNAEDLV